MALLYNIDDNTMMRSFYNLISFTDIHTAITKVKSDFYTEPQS